MAPTTNDESQIASLLTRERWFRDTCRWGAFRDCYHPDSSKTCVDLTWYKGEIDPFVAHSEKLASSKVSITHLITPAVIEIRGSKAFTESGCVIMSRFDVDEHDYDFSGWCRLVSQIEKVGSKWKLLTLEVIYIRDLIVPVPGSPELDLSDFSDWPRKSYRFAAWHLAKRGLDVRKDLPGTDNEESIKEVMDRNLAWLDAS